MNPGHNRFMQPQAPPLRTKKPKSVLRTHKSAFFLIAFYVAIILTSWIVTARLSFRPLTKPSWTYAPGISYKDYKLMQAWARAIPILNAVAAVLAVPIISSVIAQATVVFAQKRHPGQQMSVRQLFTLADRSWGNLGTVLKALWWDEPGHARVNWYLIACTGLVVLGAVQFPLYQLLAPWKEITVTTCVDTSYINYVLGKRTCDFDYRKSTELGYTQIGIDLEPAQIAIVPQRYILPRLRNDLANLRDDQAQSHVWSDPLSGGDTNIGDEGPHGFIAALPRGATTGVLREHIMRLNSTVSCTSLDVSEFPANCSGENPFQASLEYRGYFELGNVHNGDSFGPLLEKWPIIGSSPDEYQFHDYMGLDWTGGSREGDYVPSEEDTKLGGASPVPDSRTWRDDPYAPETYTNMSGPLITSVLALFGPASWLNGLANLTSARDEDRNTLDTLNSDQPAVLSSLCDALPFRHFTFSPLGDTYGHEDCGNSMLRLMMTYSDHMSRWSQNTTAESRLSAAMLLANQAALTSHAQGILPWQRDTGREIYTAPGIKVRKPDVSLPSLIILSVIVGVQILGLLWLGCWIFMWPTWTRTLNAMAIARVAASIDRSLLPPLGIVGQNDWEKLAHVDGLIGVELHEVATEQLRGTGTVLSENATDEDIEMRALSVASTVGKMPASEAVPASAGRRAIVSLGLGGPGLISKKWGKQDQSVSSRDHTYA
ncbi:hypothetical protein E8E12_000544 [Didymella heteroderae]|uniref:Uncharacterized protein n=1 Tax=Didymella heteroderae TaxID=1769908 RepID=A0A9P4WG99_9PLEO|nr:hypothetical protein E8E12_000544 [Didymella heteroderae]